jgi:hypothetical protein
MPETHSEASTLNGLETSKKNRYNAMLETEVLSVSRYELDMFYNSFDHSASGQIFCFVSSEVESEWARDDKEAGIR